MKTKLVVCIDCGSEILVTSKNNKTTRCDNCQKEYVKSYDRERKKRIPSSTQNLNSVQSLDL
jgi:DNA-directed RNA polymerase subunit M/transcription elongation factor TFIIS